MVAQASPREGKGLPGPPGPIGYNEHWPYMLILAGPF